jgi:sphingolipid delta-4 desaturase
MGSGDAEVHQRRRLAIQQEFPEVLKLVGPDSRTQYYAYAVIIIQAALAYVVKDSFLGAIILGLTISPYMDFAVLVLIHEVSHSLVFAYPLYNRLLGIFTNMVFLAPVSEVFRQHHNMHHRHLGDVHKDVDVPGEREMKAIGNSTFLKTIWLIFSVFILPIRSMKKLPVYWSLLMVLNWVVCLSFMFTVLYFSKPAFVYLIMGMILSQSMHPANARQVQRHIKVYSTEDRTVKDDPNAPLHEMKINTFSYYGGLNFLTLNVGFHVEHHDFGNVPWTRLPELRRIAGEKWYPSNTAYYSRGFNEIFAFITNPRISLADYAGRVPRSRVE